MGFLGVDEKMKITALVVGWNEASVLGECLDSLSFCDEVMYLDLGSSDQSLSIAHNRKVIVHLVAHHPVVEAVLAENINLVRHRWVLLVDPDERVSLDLASDFRSLKLEEMESQGFAAVSVPWQFYFKSKPLQGTPWGGVNRKAVLFDRSNCVFVPDVHRGKRLAANTKEYYLGSKTSSHLIHRWIRTWPEAIEKHFRYANIERLQGNARWTLLLVSKILLEWPKRFVESFIICKGYRDLYAGFLLSILWASYQTHTMLPPLRKSSR